MQLRVTAPAEERYHETLAYYFGFMTEREIRRVARRVQEALDLLEANPGAGAYEGWMNEEYGRRYRRWIVGHIKLVYHVDGDIIWVTDIFDSRQDPRLMRG